MKLEKLMSLFLMAFVMGVSFNVSLPAVSAQPPSYELVCKGGGGMFAQYKAYHAEHAMGINIRKAPRAASRANPPGPGECAWVDRPLNDQEPTTLSWKSREGNLYVEIGEGENKIEYVRPQYISSVLIAIEKGNLFRVMCYNNGTALVITGRSGGKAGEIDTR